MGCTVRDKHIRTNRRARSSKPETDPNTDKTLVPKSSPPESSSSLSPSGQPPLPRPLNCLMGPATDPTQMIANPNSNPPHDDATAWGYCTEEQLEDILLKNLEFLYNEAVTKLIALGYEEEVAMRAILRNGHCYGGMDVLTNILHNSLAYLNSGNGSGGGGAVGVLEENEPVFTDLRQLEEYSLAGMVCLLQQVKPHLSKGDAMWCLLMSDLHVGRASVMEIPVLPNGNANGNGNVSVNGNVGNNVSGSGNGNGSLEGVVNGSVNGNANGNGVVGVAPALCRFHGGWGFGNGGTSEFPSTNGGGLFSYAADMSAQREIECPKRFNLTPSMKSLLKRNVAAFAAGFRANSKQAQQGQSQACPSSVSSGGADAVLANGSVPAVGGDAAMKRSDEPPSVKNQDVVNAVLSKFRDLNIQETAEHIPGLDHKDEMILSLIHQIKELERQVKERKEWAHQKAMQAARKLSNDLTELKMLRMERDETQRLKKGKQTLEDTTMKRLSEMENALRKASGQVDRANAAVRKLETENAEIRAEMEASKLSASESVNTCLEVAKREKKCLKRLLAWERQKTKLQEDIVAEKQRITTLQQELVQIEAAQKEAEAKWRQEQKGKEAAQAQLDEQRRLKEAAEANNKRRLEALRLKTEIDFQRHKDDLQRLQQELSRLKASAQSTELHYRSNSSLTGNSEGARPHEETIATLLHQLDKLEDSSEKDVSSGRECLICMKDEVSVVFLPCAHQVLCANCNDDYGKKGRATCPCCRVPIEQRIRVFGASS